MEELSDAELVARCRAGDPEAWRALVERFSRYVYAIATQAFRLRDHDAEDEGDDDRERLEAVRVLRRDTDVHDHAPRQAGPSVSAAPEPLADARAGLHLPDPLCRAEPPRPGAPRLAGHSARKGDIR